jgi:FMN-dependent NADH-azoreductase
MNKILSIISSPRGSASASIQLAQVLTDQLVAAYPGSIVKTTDLAQKNFPHLEELHLTSFFTPPDKHTGRDKEAIRHSEEAIKEILEADIPSSAPPCIISAFLPR